MALACWPPMVPEALTGLYDAVATRLGATCTVLEVGGDLATGIAAGDSVLVVVDAAVAAGIPLEEVLDGVLAVAGLDESSITFVVGDGYLGTDDPSVAGPMAAAAAVTTARSIATRRTGASRANVVAIPSGFFGEDGGQRGTLAHEVEGSDVVEAVSFLLGPEAGYVNGQVLFVDGGRHVFSSMTA